MSTLLKEVFGKSPFVPLVEHAHKVHECVKLIRPLTEALVNHDYDEIHRLQDEVSRLEYEADQIKFNIREQLPRRFFLPVDREDLDRYLHYQDNIADFVEDYAVILFIRKTILHPDLVPLFNEMLDQVVAVSSLMMSISEDMLNLAETSFSGVEARGVLKKISQLGEGEWHADRIQRRVCHKIYSMENELDPITIIFYEKMLHALSSIANAAENTGDILRAMIVKG